MKHIQAIVDVQCMYVYIYNSSYQVFCNSLWLVFVVTSRIVYSVTMATNLYFIFGVMGPDRMEFLYFFTMVKEKEKKFAFSLKCI